MNKYQWPADKLTEKEMAILYNWRQRTKIPINQLLAQAIVLLDKIVKPEPVMGKGGDVRWQRKK